MASDAAESDTEPQLAVAHRFPAEDSLCEGCGYPLKGLPPDAVCPECGLAVAESSPVHRTGIQHDCQTRLFRLMETMYATIAFPKATFRAMPVHASRWSDRWLLIFAALMAGAVWKFLGGHALQGEHRQADVLMRLVPVFVIALTYIEMLGVTAISRRRGWRVPFALAERVCCRASVAWVPGLLIAGGAMWVLKWAAFGEPWFESLVGLVKVRWLFYGLLFILSLLWFETLVWLGVRQVKYANAWPESEGEQ